MNENEYERKITKHKTKEINKLMKETFLWRNINLKIKFKILKEL